MIYYHKAAMFDKSCDLVCMDTREDRSPKGNLGDFRRTNPSLCKKCSDDDLQSLRQEQGRTACELCGFCLLLLMMRLFLQRKCGG